MGFLVIILILQYYCICICIYFVTCRCWLVDVGIFVLWQAVDLWIFWSLMNGKLCGALKRLALATRALRLICMKDCMAGRFTFTFFIFIYSVSHFACECMHSSLIQRYYGEWLEKRSVSMLPIPGISTLVGRGSILHLLGWREVSLHTCKTWCICWTCWSSVTTLKYSSTMILVWYIYIYAVQVMSFQHLTMQLGNFYGNRPEYGLPVSRTSWPKQHELCFRSRQGAGQLVGWLAWGYSSRASHPNLWGQPWFFPK